jgi:3-phenylpropionate/cinnamic acid dioxygenase small subunit
MDETTSSIEAERDIAQVLALYCHVVDDGQFERLGEVFSERGAFLMNDEGPRGLTPLIEHFRVIQAEERRGVHVLSAPHISVDGDRAEAKTDVVFFYKGSSGWKTSAIGRYVDEMVETSDGWRIETRAFNAK